MPHVRPHTVTHIFKKFANNEDDDGFFERINLYRRQVTQEI